MARHSVDLYGSQCDQLIAMGEKLIEDRRRALRESLACDLLLKLVEGNPHDREYNVRAAVEYTDALLAKLEEPCGPTK